PQALALLTHKPSPLLGASCGTLATGAAADLCLFAPDQSWLVQAGKLPGRAQNTPFDGRPLEGRVLGTWKGGRRVYGAVAA
ncbi:MAG: dihydroorotase, partial [Acetobacter persici]